MVSPFVSRIVAFAEAFGRAPRRFLAHIYIDARRSAFRRFAYAAVLALLLTACVSFLIASLPQPDTLTILEARTETVEFTATNPHLATFPIDGFSMRDVESGIDRCVEGKLTPDVKSAVQYLTRPELQVVVTGGGVIRAGDSEVLFGSPEDQLPRRVLFARDSTCGEMASSRLPIWGPGMVGNPEDARADTGAILVSGALHVFGKTVELGVFGKGGALYPAYDEPIPLPAGGHVWTALPRVPEEERSKVDGRAALFGFASVEGRFLQVNVSTDARTLMISRPGESIRGTRIEIDAFTQALNDPNVLKLQGVIVLFFAFLPLMVSAVMLVIMEARKD